MWSSIEKQKNEREKYKAQQKLEYMDMLRAQGIDVSKINFDSIEFVTEDEMAEDQDNEIQVIE